MRAVIVRRASKDDAAAVAPLLGQLGYPVEAEVLAARFDRAEANDAAWVALSDEATVGFAAGHWFYKFELSTPVAELTALVVDELARGGGAGRALVDAFEAWVVEHGVQQVSVATAFHRVGAHAFYERLGYTQLARKYQKGNLTHHTSVDG